MTNEPIRFFEQCVLIDPVSSKTIIERRYSTGEIEYWSVLTLGYQNAAGQTGNAQVPFQIKIPDSITVPDAEYENGQIASTQNLMRQLAFANFDAALKEFEPQAKAEVTARFQQHERREKSKILLAGAMPALPHN